MPLWKRALFSITRRPIRTGLLFGVAAILSLMIFCGFACRSASVQVQDHTRQAIGAGFRLEVNQENRQKAVMELSKQIQGEGSLNGFHQKRIDSEWGETWFSWTDNSFETILESDIMAIANVPGIREYNIVTAITPVNGVNFTRVEDPELDPYGDIGGVCLIGCRKMDMDIRVVSGDITLCDGRMVTEEDQNVCVISQQLSQVSGKGIGDRLQFNSYRDREHSPVQEAVIIGIYSPSPGLVPLMSGDTYRWENVIFTDLRFPEKAENEDSPVFQTAYFQVEDVDAYDAVKRSIEAVPIGWERYDLIDRNGNITVMADNFLELKQVGNLFIGVSAVSGFLILFLVFLFWMRSRVKELGILLAMGFSKGSLMGQILLEGIATTLTAVCLAAALSPWVGSAGASYLAKSQEEQSALEQELHAAYVLSEAEAVNRTLQGVQTQINAEELLLCGGGMVIMVGLSASAAGIQMLRKRPRELINELR